MKPETEAVTNKVIKEGQEIIKNAEIMLKITRSLQRCIGYTQKDPTKARSGIIRAFSAAKERVQNL